MLKQKLQQRLLQKLSPQQIQMIKLLEIPTFQLEQRIKKELEENPLLDDGKEQNDDEEYDEGADGPDEVNDQDELSLDEYIEEDAIPSYKLSAKNYSNDDRKDELPFSVGRTFHDYLEDQLGLRILSERQLLLANYIIGNIDEDGYLRRELDAIINDMAFSFNIETSKKELEEVLKIIQDFDPVGVGARNLRECLLLQLKVKDQASKSIILAEKILGDFFEEFTKKHYDKIMLRTGSNEKELKQAVDEILHLNPKPGSAYSDPLNKTSQHIIPDFILENKEGQLMLSLNSRNVPDLHISRTYADMIETYTSNKGNHTREEKEAITFVKQKLDSAKWFIDAIKQRHNTLMVTMEAILGYQKEYFLEGDETRLKPMILKDIADITKLDISTISRVANSKYIQTHFGILPLKYFFSEGMQTDSGEEVSTREIKMILQENIEKENKRKPLTDDKLSEILRKQGYNIARRTVAKYREQLNIPVARMRKELK